MKITPISNEPSLAVAVVADEENVIATKNDFDTASREDDDDDEVEVSPRSLSSSSRWTICVIAGVIAFVAAAAIFVAIPLVNTIEAESPLQVSFGMNQSDNNEPRIIKKIISNAQHGTCSIDEHGSSITYTPKEGFFGTDTCTYKVLVCSDTDLCDDYKKQTITVVVTDPDAPVTSPDAIVLVSEETTEPTTISIRAISTTPAQATTTSPDEEGGATYASTTTVPTTAVKEGDKAAAATTIATTTTDVPTTTSAAATDPPSTTIKAKASGGGIEMLIGTKWKAMEIMWLANSSSEELKETTEEDRHPITLIFDSDTRASGYCGNNRCWSNVSLRADRLRFNGFGRTRMVASEQENNYVYLLQNKTFFYEVLEEGSGLLELRLYEIVIEGGLEKRGRLMATYVQDDEEDV